MNNNKSLAETFAENEKRAKRFTIGSLCIFVILIVAGTILALQWKKSERVAVDAKKREIIARQQSDSAVAKLSLLNDSINNLNQQLQNSRKTDSIRKIITDSIIKQNPVIENVFQQKISKEVKEGNIYLQYIQSYAGTLDSTMGILRSKGLNVLGAEKMKRANFQSSVKYFNEEDKETAQKIATLLSSKLDRFKTNPLRIVSQDLSAPKGQIEVWLGEPLKLNVKQIISYQLNQQ